MSGRRRVTALVAVTVLVAVAVLAAISWSLYLSSLRRPADEAEKRYPMVLAAVQTLMSERYGLPTELSGATETVRPGSAGICSFTSQHLTSGVPFEAATNQAGQQVLQDILTPYDFTLGPLTMAEGGFQTLQATDNTGVKLNMVVGSKLTSVQIMGIVSC